MSLFGLKKAHQRYGVIFDIGSGSVLAAIVQSIPSEKFPKIVWAHREHAPLRNIDSLEQSAKAVMTALVNTSILLDSEGRKALLEYDSSAEITEVQCGISAPWSYTVTKTINYTQDEPFLISDDLLEELMEAIEAKINTELRENEALQDLGLQVITKVNMDIMANGYHVKNPSGSTASSVVVSQGNAVTQQYLIDAIAELKDKLFPNADVKKTSFILMLHTITSQLLQETYDVCLIDVTYEATEIGIVRDGVLSYSTHTPFGTFSLAREIAEITKVPIHEAFGYLHTDKPYEFINSLAKAKQNDINELFDNYTEKVSQLFHETGDNLSIPRKISIHSDLKSETLFIDLVRKAAKRAIKTDPFITSVSKELIKRMFEGQTKDANTEIPTDTAMLLSAQFFHTNPEHHDYKYF